jgi:hypothetical protein
MARTSPPQGGKVLLEEWAVRPAVQGTGKGETVRSRVSAIGRRKPVGSVSEAPGGAKAPPGKSSPRDWQQDRHGKPHPGQGQIGEQWRGSRCSRVGC